MTICVLLRTHKITPGVLKELNNLKISGYPVFLSFDNSNTPPPDITPLHCCSITDLKAMTFYQKSWNKIRHKDTNIFKHNPEYALLHFWCLNRQYDYYWFLEDDIRYINNGKYKEFFGDHLEDKADLLSYNQSSNKYIKDSIRVDANEVTYTNMNLYKYIDYKLNSYLQIARYSNRALQCLYNAYFEGISGLNELIVPTVLHYNGMNINKLKDKYFDKRWYSDLPIKREWVKTDKQIIVHSIKD